MGSAKQGGHSAVDENKESDIRRIVDNKLHAQNKRDTANTEEENNQVEFYYRNQITSNYI